MSAVVHQDIPVFAVRYKQRFSRITLYVGYAFLPSFMMQIPGKTIDV